jgi:hypothetical protein
MIGRGVKVMCANGDNLTVTNDSMRKALRQIAGAFMELEKTRLADKLVPPVIGNGQPACVSRAAVRDQRRTLRPSPRRSALLVASARSR